MSERPETWRARERDAEPAAGASESAVVGRAAAVAGRAAAVAGRAAAAAEEAAPMAGASPPVGSMTSQATTEAWEVGEGEGVEAAPPAGTTVSQAATTAPVAESPPGNEGVEETWVVLLAAS